MNFDDRFSQLRIEIEESLQSYTAYSKSLAQAPVMEAMRYSLLGGGKRIRAVLALEFCKAFGSSVELALPVRLK